MKQKLFLLGIGSLTGHKIATHIKNDFELYGSYNLRNPNLDFVTSFKLDITNLKKLEILEDAFIHKEKFKNELDFKIKNKRGKMVIITTNK